MPYPLERRRGEHVRREEAAPVEIARADEVVGEHARDERLPAEGGVELEPRGADGDVLDAHLERVGVVEEVEVAAADEAAAADVGDGDALPRGVRREPRVGGEGGADAPGRLCVGGGGEREEGCAAREGDAGGHGPASALCGGRRGPRLSSWMRTIVKHWNPGGYAMKPTSVSLTKAGESRRMPPGIWSICQ